MRASSSPARFRSMTQCPSPAEDSIATIGHGIMHSALAWWGRDRGVGGNLDDDSSPIRVLVVDDDPGIIELMSAVAKSHPLVEVVAGARSPEEALAVSRHSPPDAILLDHHFPTAQPAELNAPM